MQLESKVAIVIITYNCHQIFLKQIEKIQKHWKDCNGDIIIVDNSTRGDSIEHIKYHSKRLSLTYLKTSAGSLNSSSSHSFAANFSYNMFKEKYTHFFYLDHDCFPIKDFSVIDLLGSNEMAGLGQEKREKYYWPGCLMFKKQYDGIDFSPLPGLDTGGSLYKLMNDIGYENLIFFDEVHEQNPEFDKSFYNFYSLINDSMFFHFINASNWNDTNDHQERLNSLINVLDKK